MKAHTFPILKLSSLILLLSMIGVTACGRSTDNDNDEEKVPTLKSKVTDPKEYDFGKIQFDSQFIVQTAVGSDEVLLYLNEKDGKYSVEFRFEPQVANSDQVGEGMISVSIGSNMYGQARANSREVFDEDQSEMARRLGSRYYKPKIISSSDVEVNNISAVHAQYTIKWTAPFVGETEQFVTCLYYRISNHRSLTVRVVSDYDLQTIWPEQRAAVGNLLGSFQLIIGVAPIL